MSDFCVVRVCGSAATVVSRPSDASSWRILIFEGGGLPMVACRVLNEDTGAWRDTWTQQVTRDGDYRCGPEFRMIPILDFCIVRVKGPVATFVTPPRSDSEFGFQLILRRGRSCPTLICRGYEHRSNRWNTLWIQKIRRDGEYRCGPNLLPEDSFGKPPRKHAPRRKVDWLDDEEMEELKRLAGPGKRQWRWPGARRRHIRNFDHVATMLEAA